MMRFACAALAAGVLLTGWAAPARAHDDEDEGPEAAEEHHPGPPPHEMSEKMLERMKQKLGLSDEQSAKLKEAMKSHRETVKPVHEQVKAGMEKLKDQLKAKAPDAEVQATLDSLKSARKTMTAEQEKFHESLGAILTPTQQAKMLVHMGERMHRGPWKERAAARKRGPRRERREHDEDGD